MMTTAMLGGLNRWVLAVAVLILLAAAAVDAGAAKASGIKDKRGEKLKDCVSRGAEAVHGPDWKTKAKSKTEQSASVTVKADPEKGYDGETYPPSGSRTKNADADADDALDIAVQQTTDTVSDYEIDEMCKLTATDSPAMKAVKDGKASGRSRPTRSFRRRVTSYGRMSSARDALVFADDVSPVAARGGHRRLMGNGATVCNATEAIAEGQLCEAQTTSYDTMSGHGGAADWFRANGWWSDDTQLVDQGKLANNVVGCIAAESVVLAAETACAVLVGVWPDIFSQDVAKAICEAAAYALNIFVSVCHSIEDRADIINDGIAGNEAVTIYENSIGIVINQKIIRDVLEDTRALATDTKTRTVDVKVRAQALITRATAIEGVQDTITGTTLPAAKTAITTAIQNLDDELTKPAAPNKGKLVVLEEEVAAATAQAVSSAQAAAGESAAAFAFIDAQLVNTTAEVVSAAAALQADIAAADAAIKAMLCQVQDSLALLEKEVAYQRQLLLTAEPSRPAWDGGSFLPLYWIPCAVPTSANDSTTCNSPVPNTLNQQRASYTCADLPTGYVN